MIEDFHASDGNSSFDCDLCVIGAGAAGIAIAREFLGDRRRVIVIESGGKSHEPATHELYRSEVVGLAHDGANNGRARVLGGTTTLWAGQALPLEEMDFQERDWVPDSGWPLARTDLDPYYRRAECVMNLPTVTYDERSWPRSAARPPPFDPAKLRSSYSQFCPTPNFGRTYQAELRRSPNVTVLLHANVVAIRTNAARTAVDRIEFKSLGGKSGVVRAKVFVVCCGGIETARLLLASHQDQTAGLGNAHDLVGRYFQDHIHTKSAVIHPRDRKRLLAWFNPFRMGRLKYAPKFQVSEELQRRERILNVMGDLCYDIPADSAVEAAKVLIRATRDRKLRPQVPGAIWNLARQPHHFVAALYDHFVSKQTIFPHNGTVYLGVQSEPQPNPASRVMLGETFDALGMRRAVIDWRLTSLDKRTIEVFVNTVAAEFERLQIGTLDLANFTLPDDPKQLDRVVHDSSHHMGTTRMHDDPKRGVVDRHCRVHGLPNLYIGSSSVFPTSGFSNPTLTILALCMRISDRLKQELA